MKITKSQKYNLLAFVIIILFIVPQTRKPIQIGIHKVFGLFSPSVVSEDSRATLENYDWKLVSNSGEGYNLEESKGSVVFVNLWATWCPPCIAEMPEMQKLYDDYKGKITFLFVSNENQNRVNTFLKKKKYNFPTFQPSSNMPEQLYSKSIPATYIINKKGEIVIDKRGAANWNGKSVRDLLDQLILE